MEWWGCNMGLYVRGAHVLVLGLTFKENCPDVRNSKVVDVIRELEKYGAVVDVHDPWINAAEARHEQFKAMRPAAVRQLCRRNHVLFDIKYVFPRQDVDGRL
jgi:UDP-N-acetyl-D-galactosamine dehydrogenase